MPHTVLYGEWPSKEILFLSSTCLSFFSSFWQKYTKHVNESSLICNKMPGQEESHVKWSCDREGGSLDELGRIRCLGCEKRPK